MEVVISDEEKSTESIIFSKLKCLILKHLSSLICFSLSCSFEFPALKMVRVKKIPKMEKFSDGSQSTPQLKAINVTFIGKCWWGDLNATIKKLHKKNGMYYVYNYRKVHTDVLRAIVNNSFKESVYEKRKKKKKHN